MAAVGLTHVVGPRDAGPGERHKMLAAADEVLDSAGVERANVLRVDVPSKSSERGDDAAALRPEVEPLVPALQSGSLFGERTGVLVVDAHGLLVAEADVIADLLESGKVDALTVLLSEGALPRRLAGLVRSQGEVVSVKKLRERDAAAWLSDELKRRDIAMSPDAAGALVQRFGSDVAGMGQAVTPQLLAGFGVEGAQIAVCGGADEE